MVTVELEPLDTQPSISTTLWQRSSPAVSFSVESGDETGTAGTLHGRLFVSGDVENVDKLIKKSLLDTFRQTDEDFLKKASSQ